MLASCEVGSSTCAQRNRLGSPRAARQSGLSFHFMAHITIATRESRLALWQAHHVRDQLVSLGHDVSLLGMTTKGDQILDQSLSKIGGKGLFVKELEMALQDGRADIAVHSLKDVPMALPEGFELACISEREDATDAWVSNRFAHVAELPLGACVGTSSLRRQALLHAQRPDLRIEPLRGNLDTRLRKLDQGGFDGIVLASAGLMRLGLESRIRARFALLDMPPAAGQAALGIEIRSDRPDLRAWLAPLNHWPTALACSAERAVSRALGGSCTLPLAAHATWLGDAAALSPVSLHLNAAFFDDTTQTLRHAQRRAVVGDLHAAHELGQAVAHDLAHP